MLHFLKFPDLASFLLARASRSTRLANYFYWYLSVECSEGKDMLKYDKIRLKFLETLKSVSKHTHTHISEYIRNLHILVLYVITRLDE